MWQIHNRILHGSEINGKAPNILADLYAHVADPQ